MEGLSILRRAIYDPLEGLQISQIEAFRNGGIGFDFWASLTCCTCCRMIIRGVGVGGLYITVTSLTSTSLTLRNMQTLHMLPYDHQGGGGWGGVSSVVTADGARGFAASCVKDYPHKRFKMAQVNHKQHIFTKTYHFRGRLWGKSYRTIVAGTQQMDGTWKHFKKWRHMSTLHKKSQQVHNKRYTWAYSWTWRHNAALLQSVALKRREEEKKWMSECRPDMIRMFENHRFLMFFFDP